MSSRRLPDVFTVYDDKALDKAKKASGCCKSVSPFKDIYIFFFLLEASISSIKAWLFIVNVISLIKKIG